MPPKWGGLQTVRVHMHTCTSYVCLRERVCACNIHKLLLRSNAIRFTNIIVAVIKVIPITQSHAIKKKHKGHIFLHERYVHTYTHIHYLIHTYIHT